MLALRGGIFGDEFTKTMKSTRFVQMDRPFPALGVEKVFYAFNLVCFYNSVDAEPHAEEGNSLSHREAVFLTGETLNTATLFVKNLPNSISRHNLFNSFGNVESFSEAKIQSDLTFSMVVVYDDIRAAGNAVEILNSIIIEGIQLDAELLKHSTGPRKSRLIKGLGWHPFFALIGLTALTNKYCDRTVILEEVEESIIDSAISIRSVKAVTEASSALPLAGSGKFNLEISKKLGESKAKTKVELVDPLNIDASRTTLMIRNIPNKYTPLMLRQFINQSAFGLYDFLYLRMDFKNNCNVGALLFDSRICFYQFY